MIAVEALTADDWVAWRALRRRALAEDPDAFAASTAAWTGPDDVESRWRGRIEAALRCFLARDGDRPVAMVAVDPGPDDETVTLASMWVAPQARRRGVGRALVDAVVAEAGGRAVVLRVMAGNAAAVQAYRAAGFEPLDGPPDAEGCTSMRRPPSPRASLRP